MVTCLICNKSFKMITNSHLKSHNISPEEYLSSYEGAVLYDESMRQKITKTRHTVERPVCKHPECFEVVSQSHNKFCSYKCSMSFRMSKEYGNQQSGKNNHSYKDGGSGFEKRQKLLARQRDKYECQSCGVKVVGKSAHVHHITAVRCFDNPNDSHTLDNLVTLCVSCHKRIDWETLKEATNRAVLLDQLLASDSNHVSFEQFKYDLFPYRNKLNKLKGYNN